MLKKVELIDSIFCANINNIDVLSSTKNCYDQNCICQSNFESLIDLFSHLYYLIDGKNYINFLSLLKNLENEEIKKRSKEIKGKWDGYLLTNPYVENEFRYIDSQTIDIIKSDLQSQTSLENILVSIVFWLKILDTHLVVLNDYLKSRIINKMVFETRKYDVLIKISSTIADYIFDNRYASPHVNPNQNNLNKEFQNIYFAKKNYEYYEEVEHKLINENEFEQFKNLSIENLKIGYLSGSFSISDYSLNIKDHNDNEKYFSFLDPLNVDDYFESVEKQLKKVINEDPHFIILPELFSPLALQYKIHKQIENHYDEKISKLETTSLILALPGSYHSVEDKFIYNKSIISNGAGIELSTVYKHNEYRIKKNQSYSGKLNVFKDFDGIEEIALNKRRITIYDTPLGRIVILICIDFLIDNVARVIEDRRVDLIFVMAMTTSPSEGKFKRRIEDLSEKNKAVIVIGNNNSSEVKNVMSLPGYKGSFISNLPWEVKQLKDYLKEE